MSETSSVGQIRPLKSTKPRRWLWILGGILLVLLVTALSGFLGYQEAIRQRIARESSQVALKASEQFELGLVDLKEERIDIARQRFEYVIKLDPQFPGALQKLAEVSLIQNRTATPTLGPTATASATPIQATPTKDTRGEADLFTQAKQFMADKQWTKALETMDALRKLSLTYRAVDVDGMYYIALRYRGVDRILKEGSLEQGMYDLALVERFGPLDTEADGYRNMARIYISGASFWKINWEMVVANFSQVYLALPYLRDGSNMTATDRFRLASLEYGNQLAAAGEYCKAQVQYENALSVRKDTKVEPTATQAADKCKAGDQPTPSSETATFTPTPTLTPTGTLALTPTAASGTPLPTQSIPTQTPGAEATLTPSAAPASPTPAEASATPVPPTAPPATQTPQPPDATATPVPPTAAPNP